MFVVYVFLSTESLLFKTLKLTIGPESRHRKLLRALARKDRLHDEQRFVACNRTTDMFVTNLMRSLFRRSSIDNIKHVFNALIMLSLLIS